MLYFLQSLLGNSGDDVCVAVDIGSTNIKVVQVDLSGNKPKLIAAATAPTPSGAFSNNSLVKTDEVASALRSLLEANGISALRAVTAVPGPCAFTKKIVVAGTDAKEVESNIAFEAQNYVPHNINAVHMDYQVLRPAGKNSLEVLLVAVKNEIVFSLLKAIETAGLEPIILDVDYFAIENMFELNYPEEKSKTIALVDVGSRFSSVNILQNGESLFTGDIGVGSRLYSDALGDSLNLKPKEVEQVKLGKIPEGVDANAVGEILDRVTEHIATELQRQIGFFWNAASTDKAIECIYLCGGGSLSPGLVDELSAKTGISCKVVNPLQGLECPEQFEPEYLQELSPILGVSVGLAIRRLGDKEHAFGQQ